MLAIERFLYVRNSSLLEDYELVQYVPEGATEPVPAVELSFIISLPNGFKYRGFVDAVLRHKTTGAIVVLEVKTTGYCISEQCYIQEQCASHWIQYCSRCAVPRTLSV